MPEVRIEPKVKVVAPEATGRLTVPFFSTRPVAVSPLTVPPSVNVAAAELLLELLELELLLEELLTELELLLTTELELLLAIGVLLLLLPPPHPALISATRTLSGTVERTSVALERFDAFIEWQFLLLRVSGKGLWRRT